MFYSLPQHLAAWPMLLLLSHFSHVRLCATPSLGFSRREHWSGLPFPSPMHKSEKWKWSRSVMSDSSWPHGLQPTRLLRPWDFPGKSTGVGCHCLLQYEASKKKKKTVEGVWISWDSLLGIECQYYSHILTIKIQSLDLKDFLILDASKNLWIPIGGWMWRSKEHIGGYNHNTRATLWRGGIKNGYSVMQV